MYIKSLEINGIKGFAKKVRFNFTNLNEKGETHISNWNVILAENGAGKTTALQSLALALMEENGVRSLEKFISEQMIFTDFNVDDSVFERLSLNDDNLSITWPKLRPEKIQWLKNQLSRKKRLGGVLGLDGWPSIRHNSGKVIVEMSPDAKINENEDKLIEYIVRTKRDDLGPYITFQKSLVDYQDHLYAGFGAFRRIGEKGKDSESHYPDTTRNHSFGTLFEHRIPLVFYENIQGVDGYMNKFMHDLFPSKVEASKNSKLNSLSIDGVPIDPSHASDGYRTMLALISSIAIHVRDLPGDMDTKFKDDGTCIVQGIVLIDEIDAHLHPSWQQKIGDVLVHKFPYIQFIVTTHSPFIPQVVDKEKNSTIHVLSRNNESIKVSSKKKNFSLWQSDQILMELFNLHSTFSGEINQKLQVYEDYFEKRSKGGEEPLDKELEGYVETKLAQSDFETERVDRMRQLIEELIFLSEME